MVCDHVLSDAGCPPLDVALVLPGRLQQPGQEVAGPTGVDLPENPDAYRFAKKNFKYIFPTYQIPRNICCGPGLENSFSRNNKNIC